MTYFFDSSAPIKLYHTERGSQRVETIFGEGRIDSLVVADATLAEVAQMEGVSVINPEAL